MIVPLDARALWGEARPPVAGTVNGLAFRSRLAVYGGQTILGLTNAFRAEAGISEGDEVEVVIDRDYAPREVEVSPLAVGRLSRCQRQPFGRVVDAVVRGADEHGAAGRADRAEGVDGDPAVGSRRRGVIDITS